MIFKAKVSAVIILVAAYILISINVLAAAWWDDQSIPLPPNTEQVKKEARRIVNSDLYFSYYISTQEVNQIKDFYRQKLSAAGWQERDLLKDIDQLRIPSLQAGSSLAKTLEYNLLFEKDDKKVIINFMPGAFSRDGKTRFTVCSGKINTPSQVPTQTIPLPELLTKPKKEVVPTYPGASLITLSEQAHSLKAIYSAQADIESIIAFYKTMMPDFGWSLIKEQPLEKMDSQSLANLDILPECPSCADKAEIAGSIETWFAELIFSNKKEYTCRIGFSSVTSDKMTPSYSLNMTTIMVNYEENEK